MRRPVPHLLQHHRRNRLRDPIRSSADADIGRLRKEVHIGDLLQLGIPCFPMTPARSAWPADSAPPERTDLFPHTARAPDTPTSSILPLDRRPVFAGTQPTSIAGFARRSELPPCGTARHSLRPSAGSTKLPPQSWTTLRDGRREDVRSLHRPPVLRRSGKPQKRTYRNLRRTPRA